MLQTTLGIILALCLTALLARHLRAAPAKRQAEHDRFFAPVSGLVQHSEFKNQDAGLPKLTGRYKSRAVQIHPVTDTLATRRLPALWLLATLQTPLPVTARFDLMMRPAGPTTFSNFDLLPHTIKTPAGFPAEAVIRSDDPAGAVPAHVVAPHLALFDNRRAKELLITPDGLRLVWLLAEADRARYGVFRQADFGDTRLDPELLIDLLDRLIALSQSILDWHAEQT